MLYDIRDLQGENISLSLRREDSLSSGQRRIYEKMPENEKELGILIRHRILKNDRFVLQDFTSLALYKTSVRKFIRYWGLIPFKTSRYYDIYRSYKMDKEKFKLYYKAYHPDNFSYTHDNEKIQFTMEGIPLKVDVKINF